MSNNKQPDAITAHNNGSDGSKTAGIWYAIVAYAVWGVLPMYWKALDELPAMEILAHRILWSFVFVAALLMLSRRWHATKALLSDRKKLLAVMACGVLVSGNWLIYIWAVNSDQIVEASLGYYINPLISIFLGMVVLRERLSFWQLVSLLLAAVGVIALTFQYGSVPWVALTLAISFSLYGLVKKMVNVDAMVGLALETLIVAPLALIYILFLHHAGNGAFSFHMSGIGTTMLLIMAGVVTALPLLWFAQATLRIPLSMVGFIQYLAPSISLVIGVFYYKEPFTTVHMISFGFIWCALTLYSLSRTSFMVGLQPKHFQKTG